MAFVTTCTASISMSAAQATKRVLLTGANVGGIGGETALGLVRAVPTLEQLYLCARDERKAEAVADRVRKVAPSKLDVKVFKLDLASLVSTRNCAKAVHEQLDGAPLDVALFNAGVMACPLQYTAEDIEYQYGVNHLGHALLALSLEKSIMRSVYVSSMAVAFARARTSPPTLAEKKRDLIARDVSSYSRWPAYGDSKLSMSMFCRAMALDGADSVSLHPGVVNTELSRHIMSSSMFEWSKRDGIVQDALRGAFSTLGFKTPAQGAELSLHLSTGQQGTFTRGELYVDKNRTVPRITAPLLYDDRLCREVKDDTLQFLEKFVGENDESSLVLEPKVQVK